MVMRKQNIMQGLAAIACVLWAGGAGGIKVDWGTNGGPIVPPTPFPPTPAPQPPYRSPAPVWEDQNGDIPNPFPYKAPPLVNQKPLYPTETPSKTTVAPPRVPVQAAPATGHRYTSVVFTPPKALPTPVASLSPAQAFVRAYAPTVKPTQDKPTNYNVKNYNTNSNYNANNNANNYNANANNYNTQNTNVNNNNNANFNNNNNYNSHQNNNANNNYNANVNYNSNNYQQQQNNYNKEDNYQNVESRSQQNTANQVPSLGVKYVAGFGNKYVTPQEENKYKGSKYDIHDKYNALESNNIFGEREHEHDLDLSYDKYLVQRVKKSPTQQVYVPQQPFSYYQQQLLYPSAYGRR